MKRINVIGTSGSGKTTFAKKLANILSIEYIEIDQLFWGKNWYWPSDEDFFSNLKSELRKKTWVLDGNYTRTIPIKWENVDTIIWLDFSFIRTFYQALKRAIFRIRSGNEIWPDTGNIETFSKTFLSKDSILLWTLKTFLKNRRKNRQMMVDERYSHIQFIKLNSPKQCSLFFAKLKINQTDRHKIR